MTTVAQVKNGATLNNPVYLNNPYIVLNDENVIVVAGTLQSILKTNNDFNGYYDDCVIDIRKYDLYANDNTKI